MGLHTRHAVAIVQSIVPHYRQVFFEGLGAHCDVTLFTYGTRELGWRSGFCMADGPAFPLRSWQVWRFVFYDMRPLLRHKCKVIVLGAETRVLSNWVVLLVARLWNKRVILWGQGLNVKEYWKESQRMPAARRMMYGLADAAWFYTETERRIWSKLLPQLPSVALNNTIGTDEILRDDLSTQKDALKEKYRIASRINFIICTRFADPHRRCDLLMRLIGVLDAKEYGFLIIGGGPLKPDFSKHSNVRDFGPVYDRAAKSELFAMADLYFQGGWLGLSVVEAMAYGKPVLSFIRSADIRQGVEYGYIQSGLNGYLARDFDDLVAFIRNLTPARIHEMGERARDYVQKELAMGQMVTRAMAGLELAVEEPPSQGRDKRCI